MSIIPFDTAALGNTDCDLIEEMIAQERIYILISGVNDNDRE
jgi:hypothetical protein